MLGKRTIIDVREYDEYAAGHLPGAINIPRGILEFKIGMVPECANKDGAFLILKRPVKGSGSAAASRQRASNSCSSTGPPWACSSSTSSPV